jgi:glycosyltransferase involved in cell wall biosynthesis
MKIAIIHPFFLAIGGGEKLASVVASIYPDADIKCLLHSHEVVSDILKGRNITAMGINRFPLKYKWYRYGLPIYPIAVENIDLRNYDLIITSDSSIMKGVLVNQDATHVCYCHSPMRCLWDLYQEYCENMNFITRPIFKLGSHYVRQFDFQAAQRVDRFAANSAYIQQRIQKYYGRSSTVLYGPVETSNGYIAKNHDDYYLSVGRLVYQKRIDLLIQACNVLKRRLIIAGTGREMPYLRSISGPTIKFIGYIPDNKLPKLYAECRALLFAADEDLGLVPIEAQSCGRPVVAYEHGGALETVRVNSGKGNDTGVFFKDRTVDSIVNAIRQFESIEQHFIPEEIKLYASQFDVSIFKNRFKDFIDETLANRNQRWYRNNFEFK